jgi:hypothetical protein
MNQPHQDNGEYPVASQGPTSGYQKMIQKPKIRMMDYATPVSSVSAFCRAVIQKLIPPTFYGVGADGLANRRIVLKHIDQFIKMRRFESLSLHEVCKGMKVGLLHLLFIRDTDAGRSDNQHTVAGTTTTSRYQAQHCPV